MYRGAADSLPATRPSAEKKNHTNVEVAERLRKLGYHAAAARKGAASNNGGRGPGLPLPYHRSACAIFVDAQNAKVNHLPLIRRHIESEVLPPLSLPSIRKVYGDSRLLASAAWVQSIEDHDLTSPYDYDKINVDSMMAMDVTECLLKHSHVKTYILVTGDGDYVPLVDKLKRRGKTVVGYGPMEKASSKLARVCDYYFDSNGLVEEDDEVRDEKLLRDDQRRRRREYRVKIREERKKRQQLANEELKGNVGGVEEDLVGAGGRTAPNGRGKGNRIVGTVSTAVGNLFGSTSEGTHSMHSGEEEKSPKQQHQQALISLPSPNKEYKLASSYKTIAKTHPHLLRVPKGLLRIAYSACNNGKCVMGSSFHVQQRDHEDATWFTAMYADPITKERFLSGLVVGGGDEGDEGEEMTRNDWGRRASVRLKPPLHLAEARVLDDGKVYYKKKGHAEHAAAARAIDCYIFRQEGDNAADFTQLCLEEPYATARKGSSALVTNYEALLSQRNLLLATNEEKRKLKISLRSNPYKNTKEPPRRTAGALAASS